MSSNILKHPHITEKAMDELDFQNTLQFIVELSATKPEIAAAVEDRFDVTVVNVRTQVTMNGTKKANIRLSDEDNAEDIASRIGVF